MTGIPRLLAAGVGTLVLVACAPGVLLAATEASATATPPKIKVKSGPEAPQMIEVRRGTSTVKVEARTIRLESRFSDGNTREYAILALHEPTTGLFWWEVQQLDAKGEDYNQDQLPSLLARYRFVLRGNQVVGFRLFGRRLIIREGRERQQNFSGILESIKASMARNPSHIHSIPLKERTEVPLLTPLGRNFFFGSQFTAQDRPSKLTNAAWSEGEWTLNLAGPDGEQATVVLSEGYKVQKAMRNGKTVFPAEK